MRDDVAQLDNAFAIISGYNNSYELIAACDFRTLKLKSGIIFHVCHCGTTALSSAFLRTFTECLYKLKYDIYSDYRE